MGNSMKKFDEWNGLKTKIEQKPHLFFKAREIFYAHIGENVGFEQCGKGDSFVRPVLVFKKFNNALFWGIPLSTTQNRGKYYFDFEFKDSTSVAILSQLRLIDAKRLDRKIGKMEKVEFQKLKTRVIEMLECSEE
jgi:mRNA interferase MazF